MLATATPRRGKTRMHDSASQRHPDGTAMIIESGPEGDAMFASGRKNFHRVAREQMPGHSLRGSGNSSRSGDEFGATFDELQKISGVGTATIWPASSRTTRVPASNASRRSCVTRTVVGDLRARAENRVAVRARHGIERAKWLVHQTEWAG